MNRRPKQLKTLLAMLLLLACVSPLIGCGNRAEANQQDALAVERERLKMELESVRKKLALEEQMAKRAAERVAKREAEQRALETQRRLREAREAREREAKRVADQVRYEKKQRAARAAADLAAKKAQLDRQRRAQDRDRQAVLAVNRSFRWSYHEDGSAVLVLRNTKNYSVDFKIKCTRKNGGSKWFNVSLGAGQSTEIGYMQGWTNNWWSGDYAQAYYNNEYLWSYKLR